MQFVIRSTGLALSLLACGAATAAAQGWIEQEMPPRLTARQTGIDRVRSAVEVTVTGRVARVTVEEWFRNGGSGLGEGVYHYALPGEAVFSRVSLWQGDAELTGEMMDAGQARQIYENIVRRRKDPALVELVGHGLIRARVFPINPGETRKITLRYTQVLDRVGDAFRLRSPGGRDTVSRSLRIDVDSAARYGDPYSPTHRLDTRRDGERLTLQLTDRAARGDLEIFLPLVRGLVGTSLVTHRPVGDDGFFMVLLAPGAAVEREMVRRDLVAVLDISGSMSGEKIAQAREALSRLVGSMRDGERFRLVAFSSGVRRFAEGWTVAGAESRRLATDWVRGLGAEGGTNIAGALAEAFAAPPAADAMGVVVFLTDGQPSVGEQDPERLADQADRGRGPFRVFAVGIGHDVNTYLLDRLTERARGATQYIAPGGDIEQAVSALGAKLASPVLTDVAIRVDGGVELYDIQPERLPDLFAGDELIVFGRYRGAGEGERTLTVTGRRGGRVERFTTTAAFPAERQANDYIAPLWASRRAGALSREIRLRGQSREVMDELRRLALRYGILTEYTAYLVQEPDAVAQRQAEERMLSAQTPAPREQAGAAAIARSDRDRAYSGAVALDAMRATAEASAPLPRVGPAGAATRRIGGRLFVLRDSVWTDAGHVTARPVITVEPFSDAYFALLAALPEARPAAILVPAALMAGGRVSVKFAPGGRRVWQAGELAALVRDFRS